MPLLDCAILVRAEIDIGGRRKNVSSIIEPTGPIPGRLTSRERMSLFSKSELSRLDEAADLCGHLRIGITRNEL